MVEGKAFFLGPPLSRVTRFFAFCSILSDLRLVGASEFIRAFFSYPYRSCLFYGRVVTRRGTKFCRAYELLDPLSFTPNTHIRV